MIKTFFSCVIMLVAMTSSAQHSWVFFTDKVPCGKANLDCEVNPDYIELLKKMGYDVIGQSRWLNAAVVKGKNQDINLQGVSFVRSWQPLSSATVFHELEEEHRAYDTAQIGDARRQLEMLNLPAFHAMGHTGEGVVLGVFDGGFYKADSFPVFDSIWQNGLVKGHWDFELETPLTFKESSHGMSVLSLISGNMPDSLMGAAPHTSLLLARTEVTATETHLEEYNWVAAMEWADTMGVDIIHSSLGYSIFDTLEGDYTYSDMNGNSTIITYAAEIASAKGIFITNSAGNEGAKEWKYITAPCDGFNVLCIGAVDSFEKKANFSSFGPSADGRVKPEVMAMGKKASVQNKDGFIRTGNGTSYSGPIIAGFVACLKGAHPNRSNEELFDAIIRSADRYDMPDSAYGYGIPDILVADSILDVIELSAPHLEADDVFQIKMMKTDHLLVKVDQVGKISIYNRYGFKMVEDEMEFGLGRLNVKLSAGEPYFILFEGEKGRWTKKITFLVP